MGVNGIDPYGLNSFQRIGPNGGIYYSQSAGDKIHYAGNVNYDKYSSDDYYTLYDKWVSNGKTGVRPNHKNYRILNHLTSQNIDNNYLKWKYPNPSSPQAVDSLAVAGNVIATEGPKLAKAISIPAEATAGTILILIPSPGITQTGGGLLWADAIDKTQSFFTGTTGYEKIIRSYAVSESDVQTSLMIKESSICVLMLSSTMPNKQIGPYRTKNMLQEYVSQDKANNVRYYSQSELQKCKVISHKGRLYQNGKLYDTTGFGYADDTAIFVMDKNGNLYAANPEYSVIHHSSFLSGKPVAGAGRFTVYQGRLNMVDGISGHYRPSWSFQMQVKQRLWEKGINIW